MIQTYTRHIILINKGIINKKILKGREIASSFSSQDNKHDSVNTKICPDDISISRSTVDTHEIDLHTGLKHVWWDPNGTMKALHTMNKLRVPFIRDGLLATNFSLKPQINTPSPLKSMKILEVGCGGGILCEPLSRIGADVTGLDASGELITLAKQHSDESALKNLAYIHDTIEDYSEKHHEEFNAVVASEVIEHVTDKDFFIECCVKCLKPGGSMFITTLNKTNLSWLGGIMIAENILNIVPSGTHQWDKFIAPNDMSRLLEKHNCKTKLIHGMLYVFINNEWYWCSNTSINYAIQAVKSDKEP